MKRQEPLYSDLDLSMTRNALSGDLAVLTDELAVRRAVLRVIKIRRFDKPYEADKHAFIEEFLFEPASVGTAAAIRERLDFALKKMEPRADYTIEVVPRSSDLGGEVQGYDCEIHYTIKSVGVTGVVTEFLQRIR